jgi:TonB-dependent starch-binding outer membrane protein SusC
MKKMILLIFQSCWIVMIGSAGQQAVSQGLVGIAAVHESLPGQTSKSLQQVLQELESRYKVSILYDMEAVEHKQVTHEPKISGDLTEVLSTLLKPFSLRYEKISKSVYVILLPKPELRSLPRKSPLEGAQQLNIPRIEGIGARGHMPVFTVTGKVTDESGAGLPGVNVVLKGTASGTTTNGEGNYTLSIPDAQTGGTLIFSYIGYVTEEVPVNNRTSINIVLMPDIQSLSEVVVVGYGEQKKANLTGAVSSVSEEQLNGRPLTNMTQALSGLAAGVSVTQASGQPGNDNATIRIRGYGTIGDGNNNPLVLVDGIESSIAGINPNDIETITVLKDAASAAIYGSRAANGVILVTTKRGKKGRVTADYNTFFGWQSPTRLIDLVSDMPTHMELLNEAKANVGQAQRFSQSEIDTYRNANDPLLYPNTDWLKYYFGKPSYITQHNLSVSGGNDATVFNLSLGYLDQDGLVNITNTRRYNARLNLESKLNERFTIGTNLFGYGQRINGDYDVISTLIGEATSPGVVPVFPDGRFGGAQAAGEGLVGNPEGNFNNTDDHANRQFFLGKVYAQYQVIKGLTLQTNLALKYENEKESRLTSPFSLWNFRTDEVVRDVGQFINLSNANTQSRNITFFNTLNYIRAFGNHNVTLLLGHNLETFREEAFSASVSDLFSTATPVLGAGSRSPGVNGGISEWALLSYFGRLNYDYKSKYLFEANLRYDGSSRFSQNNRWGVFPSFSAGWVLTEENFLQDINFLNFLKLRGSWGRLGNQNIGIYPYQSVYDLNVYYNFGGALAQGIAQTELANSRIRWETTTTADVGVDAQLFNGKLNLTADYFHRLTDDILVQLPVPQTLGNKAAPFQNIAQVLNKGWEAEVRYQGKTGNFRYGIGANVTKVKNEVVKFKGETPAIEGVFITKEGIPFRSIYAYRYTGIFQTPDEVTNAPFQSNLTGPGDLRYENIDDDNRITGNDRQVIGNTIPEYTYGFTIDLGYKGFDLTALFQGVQNVDGYLQGHYVFPFPIGGERGMVPVKWLNRWTPDNTNSSVPRIVSQTDHNNNYLNSSYWMQDASYLRLKNIQVGYALPDKWVQKARMQHLRVYANAQNLFTFTKFEGFDPERSQTATTVTYPQVKVLSLGLQAKF